MLQWSCVLGGFESFDDMGSPLLGLDVERLPPARLHLLLPHLLLQHSHLSGPLGRLLLLGFQLALNLLLTVTLVQKEEEWNYLVEGKMTF